jgi:hypothetical protein
MIVALLFFVLMAVLFPRLMRLLFGLLFLGAGLGGPPQRQCATSRTHLSTASCRPPRSRRQSRQLQSRSPPVLRSGFEGFELPSRFDDSYF